MPQWNKIRVGLHEKRNKAIYEAVVAVGKVKATELPEDIADTTLSLFSHPDPEVRHEAVRAIGVHWCLASATDALKEVLRQEKDPYVRLSAIAGLGSIGREHFEVRCSVSKILANIVLDEELEDYERMVAYVEVAFAECRIDLSEASLLDRDLPESITNFDWDRQWIDQLAQN